GPVGGEQVGVGPFLAGGPATLPHLGGGGTELRSHLRRGRPLLQDVLRPQDLRRLTEERPAPGANDAVEHVAHHRIAGLSAGHVAVAALDAHGQIACCAPLALQARCLPAHLPRRGDRLPQGSERAARACGIDDHDRAAPQKMVPRAASEMLDLLMSTVAGTTGMLGCKTARNGTCPGLGLASVVAKAAPMGPARGPASTLMCASLP